MLLADDRDRLHRGMGDDEVLDLLGRHVLAADLQQVLVALLVEDVAALTHLHHVAGLEPAVLEGLGVGLVVVEVLEEELDPAGAAHPQLAGLALGAELAGLLVDDRDLVAGRDVAHRACRQPLLGLAGDAVRDRLGHAVGGVHRDPEHRVEVGHDQPEHADAQRVLLRPVGTAERTHHERHERDVRDVVLDDRGPEPTLRPLRHEHRGRADAQHRATSSSSARWCGRTGGRSGTCRRS